MDNVNVILYDMPARIKAYTIKMDEGYTICLNSRLTRVQNQISYLHEIKHIQNGDYDLQCGADLIECFSHSK